MVVGSSMQWKPSSGVPKSSSKAYTVDNSGRGQLPTVGAASDKVDGSARDFVNLSSNSVHKIPSDSSKPRGCPPGFSEVHQDASASVQSASNSSDGRFTRSLRNNKQDAIPSNRESKDSFVPYLPQDDAVAAGLGAQEGGIDAVETQEVADLLNEELGKMLKMQPLEFWKTVTMDNSIQWSLDSYLQFRRRWYDSPVNEGGTVMAGIIVGDQELCRRVFMVLYRLSSNLEPGSCASDCLSPKKHAELIREKQLLDIPKLLDICAIYGHDNPELTRRLVSNAFRAQTRYNDDLAEVVPPLLKTINTMHQRCCSTLTVISPTSKTDTSVALKLQKELLEVIDYLNDSVVALHAFVDAYPGGAIILVSVGNRSNLKEQLLPSMAAVHDTLLPTLQKGFTQLGHSAVQRDIESAAQLRLKKLRVRLVKFAWHLLCISYLSEGCALDHNEVMKNLMPTAFVEDPEARGEALVQAVFSMAVNASDSLGCQPSGGVKEDLISTGAFLRNIERRHKLMEKVDKLRQKGLIALDDAQCECISALVADKSSTSAQMPNLSHISLRDQNGGQEAAIMNESKISHIKDILPDYGNGFLAACLEAYDDNPEEVIQRILEGTLHPDLLFLDKALEAKPGRLAATESRKDKGKGKVSEVSPLSSRNRTESSGGRERGDMKAGETLLASNVVKGEADGIVHRLASSSSASSSSAGELLGTGLSKSLVSEPGKSLTGRFVRKEKGEGNAAQLLDERDAEDALRAAAYAAQYEDEYDDSFDDLGTHIADGVEETESLVDLIASRSSVGAERRSKIALGGKNDGLLRVPGGAGDSGTWRGDAPNARNPSFQRTSFMREATNKLSDINSRHTAHPTRGRGRGRREEPRGQYYVKDGKNYSYKVAGAVSASSVEEAEAWRKTEEETIHGLRQGGNVPMKVPEATDSASVIGGHRDRNSKVVQGSANKDFAGQGGVHGRGKGGPRRDQDNHHRKDRAMKKHFASVGGM